MARVIAANRKPDSHIAGGAVINRGDGAARISDDLDIFHDTLTINQNAAEIVNASADADEKLLKEAGYSVDWLLRQGAIVKAVVSRGNDHVRLEWTSDTACRFFPAQKDDEFGYCLHPADLAVNKVLALADRSEIRDFLDILHFDKRYLSLGAIIWAACGKDEGYTPSLIMKMTNRHSSYRETDLSNENLVRQVDLKVLKKQWIAARDRAETLFSELPGEELGCLYLDQKNEPVTPDPKSSEFPELIRHRISPRGSWPKSS